jgi:hypothetical protein
MLFLLFELFKLAIGVWIAFTAPMQIFLNNGPQETNSNTGLMILAAAYLLGSSKIIDAAKQYKASK